MSAPLAKSATEAVLAAAEQAGQVATESLLESLWHYIDGHWSVVFILVGWRLAQPVLWKLTQKTKTPVDDKIVKALAWVVGAVERKKNTSSDEE